MADLSVSPGQNTRGSSGWQRAQRRFFDAFLKRHEQRIPAKELPQARVLVALLIFTFLAATAMALVRYSTVGWQPSTVVVACSPLPILTALILFVRTGNRALSGDILLLTAATIIVATALSDGGLYSRVLTWLPALPLMASYTGARLSAWRITLIAALGLLVVLLGHHLGWVRSAEAADSLVGRLSASVAAMLFVAAIAHAYNDSRRRADEEREALDKTRSDWVSMVSHELRTPLTSLYGGLKLLAEGALDRQPEKQQRVLTTCTRNTERLIGLVNDILDVERLQAGELRLQLEPLALAQVVTEAIQTQQYFADEKGVTLRLEDRGAAPVQADFGRILQVVQNLLSNAIKFSPPGAEVTVCLIPTEQGARCEVRDQGVGVDAGFRASLFQRFAQQDSGTTRRSGGSGLGLFICSGIVQAHGGRIGYRAAPGGGSVFYFELPAAVTAP